MNDDKSLADADIEARLKRVDASLARQLSRSIAANAKLHTALKVMLADYELAGWIRTATEQAARKALMGIE